MTDVDALFSVTPATTHANSSYNSNIQSLSALEEDMEAPISEDYDVEGSSDKNGNICDIDLPSSHLDGVKDMKDADNVDDFGHDDNDNGFGDLYGDCEVSKSEGISSMGHDDLYGDLDFDNAPEGDLQAKLDLDSDLVGVGVGDSGSSHGDQDKPDSNEPSNDLELLTKQKRDSRCSGSRCGLSHSSKHS